MVSPIASEQVGSPTRQTDMDSSFAFIQSRIAIVPSVASASSSPVSIITRAPSKKNSSETSFAAITKAATAVFISAAPRPYNNPFLISPPNGSQDQEETSPSGTTSV